MFPTTFMPVAPEIENRHFYNFFIISEYPDNNGFSDPTSATVFYGYQVDKTTAQLSDTPSWAQLNANATITQSRFAIGQAAYGRSLIWDKQNTLLAVLVAFDGSQKFLYKSTNLGSTWTDITSTLPNTDASSTFINAYVHPGVFLISAYNGVGQPYALLRSTDKGATWTDVTSAILPYFASGFSSGTGTNFAIDNSFYLGTTNADIIVTTNGGLSWSPVQLPAVLSGLGSAVDCTLTKYNGNWQLKVGPNSKLIYESSSLSSDANDWVRRDTNLTGTFASSIGPESFTFSKTPNSTDGTWRAFAGTSSAWSISDSDYQQDGTWDFFNVTGNTPVAVGFQFTGRNVVKRAFYPVRSKGDFLNFKEFVFYMPEAGGYVYQNTSSNWTGAFNDAGSTLSRDGRCTGNFLGKYY